jgi:acetyl-CoA C-acetyltransferase
MYEAASRAYRDAEIDPRKTVDSFITTGEDLWEGWSITDEMVPDQLGGAGRPVCTIPGDALTGLGNAIMQIEAGMAQVAVVEAHSKASEVVDKEEVERLAQEPSLTRPLGIGSDTLVALEMSAFLQGSGFDTSACDEVVAMARKKGAGNPLASLSPERPGEDGEEALSSPLRRKDKARYADAAIVIVLASAAWVERNKVSERAVGLDGVAWSSSLPWLDGGEARAAGYARESYECAAERAGMTRALGSFDVIEADDKYSFKLLQHLMPLLGGDKEPVWELVRGRGQGPELNPSGGALAVGNLLDASSLHRVYEVVLQLRGEAGGRQVKGAKLGLVQSWRGVPTATGGAAILSAAEER